MEHLAGSLADGRAVDWEELEESHPGLGTLLRQFSLLEAISEQHGRESAGNADSMPGGSASASASAGPVDLGETGVPATVESDSAPAPPPLRWGPLEIRERLGEGAFGEVFRAHDPALQRDVALKLVRSDRWSDPGLHLEEARRLARIRHPNVLAIHGVETHDGRIGLWTDLLEGRTLSQILDEEAPLSQTDLLRIGIQLCRALAAIHDADLIHGDVKAANVFSEANGHVTLMDFGAGRRTVATEASTEGPLFGTPIVLAPEILEGSAPTPAGDLYSLGVLLYRGAAGRYPVTAASVFDLIAAHREGPRVPLGELRPDLPEVLTRTIDRAIARDPKARFESAGQLESSLAIALTDPSREDDPSTAWRDELPSGVPRIETRFLGRIRELSTLQDALDAGHLVTLGGPGGAGKTRLAVELARRFARRYRDGLRWVDLTATVDAGALHANLARELQCRARPQESPADSIRRVLRDQSVLLILDNVEHLQDSVREWVTEILERCPRVSFLLTSREPLGLPEETLILIGPMETPPAAGPNESDTVRAGERDAATCESVRLFLDRAVQSQRSLRPTAENLAAIARIVRQVDGLPLAIELAAARAASMDVQEIATRLERSIAILTERERGTERHRTMNATLDWSWSLLDPAERALLRRLALFRGGATMVSIERIAAERIDESRSEDDTLPPPGPPAPQSVNGFEVPPGSLVPSLESRTAPERAPAIVESPSSACILEDEVFLLLDALVKKSLVHLERGRYRVFEVVRQFVERKLDESGERSILEQRFLHHYLRLAFEADQRCHGQDQDRWFGLLGDETTNFETALRLALAPRFDPDAGLRLAASLGRSWARRGLFAIGLTQLEAQLDRPGSDAPTAHRADALNWAGNLATAMADYPRAVRFHEQNEAVQRTRGFLPGVGTALGGLGDALARMGEHDRARACLEENVAIHRRVNRPVQLSMALTKLAVFCGAHGEPETGCRLHEESLALYRERGDDSGTALALTGLGDILLSTGQLDRALAAFVEALAVRRKTGDRILMTTTLNFIVHTLVLRDELAEAVPYLQESLRILRTVRRPMSVFHFLDVTSRHAEGAERPYDALRMLCASMAARESTGEVFPAPLLAGLSRRIADLEGRLSAEATREAHAFARAVTLEETLEIGAGYLESLAAGERTRFSPD
ncbi:MAG: protein kinase [Candidatus Eisenbacteria bacterium]